MTTRSIAPSAQSRGLLLLAAIALSLVLHAGLLILFGAPTGPTGAPSRLPLLATLVPAGSAPARPAKETFVAPPEPTQPTASPSARRADQRSSRPALAPRVKSDGHTRSSRPTPAPPAASPAESVAAAPPAQSSEAQAPAQGRAEAAAPPRAASPEPIALDHYTRRLAQSLGDALRYPRVAELRGWQGDVRLRLTVSGKGGLLAAELVRSSGHEVLDANALQLVRTATLPPPPDALGDRPIDVVVPIRYRLPGAA